MYVIIGTGDCVGCENAKKLLHVKGLEFEYLDMFDENSTSKINQYMGFAGPSAMRSIPQIFSVSDDKSVVYHVGGFAELYKEVSNG